MSISQPKLPKENEDIDIFSPIKAGKCDPKAMLEPFIENFEEVPKINQRI